MDKVRMETIKKIQQMEAFYVLFSRGTNNPFIICDLDTYNDQVWVFEDSKDLEEKAKPYMEQKNPVASIKVENKSFLNFYSTLFTLGVNEVVFVEKDSTTAFDLEEIVKRPDFSQLPENQRPLFNPQLQLTGIYFMQEFRRGVEMSEKESLNELEEEMAANLVKSKFLVAVEKQEEGKEENVQVPYIKNKNGDVFQPIFTDPGEFSKFNKEKKFKAVVVEFKNLDKILIPLAKGVVVNPQGFNLIVMSEQFENLLKRFGIQKENK